MKIELKPLDQQVIVITGASSGIGLATASLAASEGAKVVLAARSEDTLAAIAAEINAAGGTAVHVVADVGKRDQVERIAETAVTRFGRIDTWINNAGVSIYGRLDEVSEEDSRQLFETNFWGVVHGSLVALPYLRRSGGALINIGSEVSDAALPIQGMYAASKHAVKGFTDALCVESEYVDKANVSITLIQPTATDTPFPQHARNYMDREPKLPPPLIDPLKVARTILDAATEHEHDVTVGSMSALNVAMAKVFPRLQERMAAKQAERQNYDEPPRNPAGALYEAGAEGYIRGTGGAVMH